MPKRKQGFSYFQNSSEYLDLDASTYYDLLATELISMVEDKTLLVIDKNTCIKIREMDTSQSVELTFINNGDRKPASIYIEYHYNSVLYVHFSDDSKPPMYGRTYFYLYHWYVRHRTRPCFRKWIEIALKNMTKNDHKRDFNECCKNKFEKYIQTCINEETKKAVERVLGPRYKKPTAPQLKRQHE